MAHGKTGYKRYRPDLLLRLQVNILLHYPKEVIYPPELAKEIREPVHQVVECLDRMCELTVEADEEERRSYKKSSKNYSFSYMTDRIRIRPMGDKYRITGNRPKSTKQEKPLTKCKLCGEIIKRTHKKSEFHTKHKCTDKMVKDIIEG